MQRVINNKITNNFLNLTSKDKSMSFRNNLRDQYNYQSLKSSPKKQQIGKECEHNRKILELRQRIKELEEEQEYLMRKNDKIIADIEKGSIRDKKQSEESEVWKRKYEALKAENDRKALKLANNATNSVLTSRNMNRNKPPTQRDLKPPSYPQPSYRKKYQNTEQLLTSQQKQYVRQLQSSKRQRSASMKILSSTSRTEGKKYSAMLPDGLVIHIIDQRNRNGLGLRE